MPIDPNTLPQDVHVLHKIVLDLCEQLRHESAEKDKYRSLLRELLEAQRSRKSEQLSKEQLDLFESLWKAAAAEEDEPDTAEDDIDDDPQGNHKPEGKPSQRRGGRQPLARHLKRERIVHDRPERCLNYLTKGIALAMHLLRRPEHPIALPKHAETKAEATQRTA